MKSQILFISLFFALAAQAEEAFVPKKFIWKYIITAKDHTNLDDLSGFNAQMRTLIEEVKRNDNPSVYQNFLNFVQQVQEAIAAGLNLYGVAQTSQEAVLCDIAEGVEAVVEEIIEQVIDQEIDDVVVADGQISKDVDNVVDDALDNSMNCDTQADDVVTANTDVINKVPMISIAIACVISDVSQTEAWNSATEKLQTLADAINAQTINPNEIVAEIDKVYNILQSVQDANIVLFAA